MGLSEKSLTFAILVVVLFAVRFTEAFYSPHSPHSPHSPYSYNYAEIVRRLVHETNRATVQSRPMGKNLKDYPMPKTLAISDSAEGDPSTGRIYFLLTDLNLPGMDWRSDNKLTLLFSNEHQPNCSEVDEDPMAHICVRALISGYIKEVYPDSKEFNFASNAFVSRHPETSRWIDSRLQC